MTEPISSDKNTERPRSQAVPASGTARPVFPWIAPVKIGALLESSLAETLSLALPREELALLEMIRDCLGEEVRFEEQAAEGEQKLGLELQKARNVWDIAPVMRDFRDLATEYYLRRRSAAAFLTLCAGFRDRLLHRVTELANAEAPLRGRYAWLASGKTGRRESYPIDREDLVLVHEDGDGPSAAEQRLRVISLLNDLGIAPLENGPFRCASLTEWRGGLLGELFSFQDGVPPEDFADLRQVAGDPGFGETFLALIGGGIDLHREGLRRRARRTATMQLAVGFLGFIRVERSGIHKGGVDLERYAVAPLTANVRIEAVLSGVRESGTLPRIRRLQERGVLDVAAAGELAAAFQAFHGIGIQRRIASGWKGDGGRFFYPDQLEEAEDRYLREGLEAVGNLEKRIYSAAAHE